MFFFLLLWLSVSQNCCADWHSHLSWGKIRSREVIRADGQSSGGSVCTCNTPAVLTLKLCCVHCTISLYMYFSSYWHLILSSAQLGTDWHCLGRELDDLVIVFHLQDYFCLVISLWYSLWSPVETLCVSAQTYSTEISCPCPGELAVLPFTFYSSRSVLSLDIFLAALHEGIRSLNSKKCLCHRTIKP